LRVFGWNSKDQDVKLRELKEWVLGIGLVPFAERFMDCENDKHM